MRITLNVDEDLLNQASRLTGIREKASLVKLGLQALIAQENIKRISKLGGTEVNLCDVPRRRTTKGDK